MVNSKESIPKVPEAYAGFQKFSCGVTEINSENFQSTGRFVLTVSISITLWVETRNNLFVLSVIDFSIFNRMNRRILQLKLLAAYKRRMLTD